MEGAGCDGNVCSKCIAIITLNRVAYAAYAFYFDCVGAALVLAEIKVSLAHTKTKGKSRQELEQIPAIPRTRPASFIGTYLIEVLNSETCYFRFQR